MSKIRIGILAGSLRKESFCKKTGLYLAGLLPADFTAKLIDLSGLAMYNQDYDDEGNPPEEYRVFRREIKESDGFLFVTPEYNRGTTAVLKNALDIGTRPFGQNVWDGKPGAVVSVTIGNLGAVAGNHQLRQSMVYPNIPLLQQPEVYLSHAGTMFDDRGEVADQGTAAFLRTFAGAFAQWVRRFVPAA
jgi:chromate reductase